MINHMTITDVTIGKVNDGSFGMLIHMNCGTLGNYSFGGSETLKNIEVIMDMLDVKELKEMKRVTFRVLRTFHGDKGSRYSVIDAIGPVVDPEDDDTDEQESDFEWFYLSDEMKPEGLIQFDYKR